MNTLSDFVALNAGSDFLGEAMALTDEDLGLILGGDDEFYSSQDLKSDMGTMADAAAVGAVLGSAIPGVGTAIGAGMGMAFGAGMVAEERFQVVENVGQFVSDTVANEETFRSNVI